MVYIHSVRTLCWYWVIGICSLQDRKAGNGKGKCAFLQDGKEKEIIA